MDERPKKEVATSNLIHADIIKILAYGIDTFGYIKAEEYYLYLLASIESLDQWYLMHPECRHLATKNKTYRNIITDSHLVIYRVVERVEVLRILHSSSSIASIRKVKAVKV